MSLPVILDAIDGLDMTLISELSWAGGRFPFAGTEDVAINTNTTWSDAAGYRKVRKLTIAAGVTLRIIRTPFYLFADEIEFGSTTSSIDISGFSGHEDNTSASFAKGGRHNYTNPAYMGGGDGGGLIVVCVSRFSGACGLIKANGGNGSASGSGSRFGGQGALSRKTGSSGSNSYDRQIWDGSSMIGDAFVAYLHPLSCFMAGGGRADAGGGLGGGSGSANGGGSGIGGGGGGYAIAEGRGVAGTGLSPAALLKLAAGGCKGGGGGYGGDSSGGGGGGGGGIGLWYRTAANVPSLVANGGIGTHPSGYYDGGAGVTFAVQV